MIYLIKYATIFIGLAIVIGISTLVISGTFSALELPTTGTTVIPGESIPTPLEIGNPVAVYDADVGVSIGVGVSQWNDQTGNGNHVTQGTGTLQPTVSSGLINGNDAISFDGVDDHLTIASFASGTIAYPDVTLATVLIPDSRTVGAIYMSGATNPQRAAIQQQVTTQNLGVFTGGSFWSTQNAGTDPVLLVFRQNATSNYLFLDGQHIVGPVAGTEGMDGINIGSFYNKISDSDIDVAYIAVYDGSLSDEDMDTLEDYFTDRYDLGFPLQGSYAAETIISGGNATGWNDVQTNLNTQGQAATSILVLVLIAVAAVVVLLVIRRFN